MSSCGEVRSQGKEEEPLIGARGTSSTGPSLNAYNDIRILFGDPSPALADTDSTTASIDASPAECLLVVDSGFSHTTITPVYHGSPIQRSIRRLDIGGKFLTNYMKEIISIRQMNLLDETHLMDQVKEAACFVSDDFPHDLERCWKGNSAKRKRNSNGDGNGTGNKDDRFTLADSSIAVDYFLPDYALRPSGIMLPHDPSILATRDRNGMVLGPSGQREHVLTLANERVAVPELLFNPGDVGMKQAGLPEAVMQSLSALPPGLWPAMLANVLLVGGNANLKGIVERL